MFLDFFALIKLFFKSFFDLILPHRCIACGDIVDSGGLVCKKCFENIDFITEPCCNICGVPFDYADEKQLVCINCLNDNPAFDLARSVFVYDGVGRKLAIAFKYADRTEATNYFSLLMVNAGKIFFNNPDFLPDLIIPVPVHRKKLILRKYNQSALLAKSISQKTGIKYNYSVLARTKNTKPQSEFGKKDRFKNVKDVFAIKDNAIIKDKNVLLIDDVLTTGATVSECAKVMKKNGAKKVYILALSRTKTL